MSSKENPPTIPPKGETIVIYDYTEKESDEERRGGSCVIIEGENGGVLSDEKFTPFTPKESEE